MERWAYPVPQAMQRHTGCRFAVTPKLDEAAPDAKAADQPAVKSEPDKEPCQEKAGAEH